MLGNNKCLWFSWQCRAGVGACPDTLDSSGMCTYDITDVSGSVVDGKQCVSFTRPFSTCKIQIVAWLVGS